MASLLLTFLLFRTLKCPCSDLEPTSVSHKTKSKQNEKNENTTKTT